MVKKIDLRGPWDYDYTSVLNEFSETFLRESLAPSAFDPPDSEVPVPIVSETREFKTPNNSDAKPKVCYGRLDTHF